MMKLNPAISLQLTARLSQQSHDGMRTEFISSCGFR